VAFIISRWMRISPAREHRDRRHVNTGIAGA
jgi:hypothetical protein